ncbi:DNA damage-regulated autophagy modulator protein 1 [Hydra vulgaris]|uniref:DNA damage-regulated autophagy modulator protein 1 n=1 Tax=Hydra vulgaris TaxID=6087 RepID=UPI001F5FAF88|nr:DNA damage-regulated autophagy modulator protein 1 [Hydra vulgaris]
MVEEKLKMVNFKLLYALLIATILISVFTCFISYIIGVKVGNIIPSSVAFISDTGDEKPNSSIFTFGLSLSCMLTFIIIVIRYYQVKLFIEKDKSCNWINQFSLICGLTLVFGKLTVAAFQISNIKAIHYFGAAMYFGGTTLFCATQSYFTYRKFKNKYQLIFLVQITSTAVMIISLIIFGIFMTPSLSKYNRKGGNVAQSFEWLLVSCQFTFLLTFLYDFRSFEIELKFREIKVVDKIVIESEELIASTPDTKRT